MLSLTNEPAVEQPPWEKDAPAEGKGQGALVPNPPPPPVSYEGAKEAAGSPHPRDLDDVTTIQLKKYWTAIISFILLSLVTFQYYYMYLLGTNGIDLRDYDWLVQIVMGTNFAAIVGLAKIILDYLFSKDSRPKKRATEKPSS